VYDEDDAEMPEMRPSVDPAQARTSGAVPELQTEPVGHTIPIRYAYFVETEDGQFIQSGCSREQA
jgi:hypothetical protein